MASAKNEAIKSLGKENDYINLSGLNTERQLANDVFNTNRTTFQNAYNDLLNTVAKNRADAKTGFTQGRGTVGENAYFANRDNLATLSSRGVDKGTYALGKLRNRINTGQQYSDLANTYYRNLDDINATETAGRNEYDYNMAAAQNSLNAALADIDAREKAGRNAYKAAVAQLAEQIQARRDANANAAAARALTQKQIDAANAATASDFENLIKSAGSYDAALKIYNSTIGNNKTLLKLIGNPKSADAYISQWYKKPSATTTTKAKTTNTTNTAKTTKTTSTQTPSSIFNAITSTKVKSQPATTASSIFNSLLKR